MTRARAGDDRSAGAIKSLKSVVSTSVETHVKEVVLDDLQTTLNDPCGPHGHYGAQVFADAAHAEAVRGSEDHVGVPEGREEALPVGPVVQRVHRVRVPPPVTAGACNDGWAGDSSWEEVGSNDSPDYWRVCTLGVGNMIWNPH
eukprot:TRINITY_DN9023_c0_g1_i2.p3 TRINITY_DN9023_c0_g1~~TRINITY_DN9023_c0_g1_i2.p3  ORF type:complete len:144 (+),score=5.48 TRINITY_DN9023_c0_g1_i2:284-715(+)